MRTAASSIASGSPSSRRHSSTTVAWFAAVSSNVPDAAAARSVNSMTASFCCSWASVSAPSRRRQFERRDRDHVLTRHLQRLPAGRDHPHLGRSAQHLAHELARRLRAGARSCRGPAAAPCPEQVRQRSLRGFAVAWSEVQRRDHRVATRPGRGPRRARPTRRRRRSRVARSVATRDRPGVSCRRRPARRG